jgi:hypothetical protein
MSLADQACGNGLAALRDGDLDLAEAHFQEALQKKFDHPKTRYAVCSGPHARALLAAPCPRPCPCRVACLVGVSTVQDWPSRPR